MDNARIEDIVKQQFADYLKSNKLRSTPERYAILNAVYSIEESFDIDTLLRHLEKDEKFRVSRATVYNTISLLIKANLVIHHQFGSESKYEKCYGSEMCYAICTRCKKITVLKNLHLKESIYTNVKKFSLTHSSLYIYGLCSKCTRATKRRKQKRA